VNPTLKDVPNGLPGETVPGVTVAVTPLGRLLTERATLSVKPLNQTTEPEPLAVWPAVTNGQHGANIAISESSVKYDRAFRTKELEVPVNCVKYTPGEYTSVSESVMVPEPAIVLEGE
jgi:hypothetical protein